MSNLTLLGNGLIIITLIRNLKQKSASWLQLWIVMSWGFNKFGEIPINESFSIPSVIDAVSPDITRVSLECFPDHFLDTTKTAMDLRSDSICYS